MNNDPSSLLPATGAYPRRTRRRFLQALYGLSLPYAPLIAAQAVQRQVARVGILIAESVADQSERLAALRAGLADLGYHDGRNLALEIRSADGQYERLKPLATDLVQAKVNVLVAFGIKALTAAREATSQIPLVIPATSSDLVALNLIRSLARPGGNITGSTTFGSEVMAERLEIAKDVLPRIGRVAVLVNPANSGSGPMFLKLLAAAKMLKLELQKFELSKADQIDSTFASIGTASMGAVVVQDDTLFSVHARALAEHAAKRRLPMVGGHYLVEAGGLIGYGRDELALYRRSAHYVDRILRGTPSADLPIEQATRFELWLNSKTVLALGVQLPEAIRIRVDRVVQ